MSQTVHINNMPELPFAMEEAINRLRINVGFSSSDIKKVLVISTVLDEGKSFIAMHLWYQMAKMGTPSILVDLDLRKSITSDKYDIVADDGRKNFRGTSHYLSGDYPLEDAVLHTDISGGDIIPNMNNVVNPAMLIESRKCREMLDSLAESYRYVFVDAPPLDMVSDGERLGSICDGAILVVRCASTSKHLVRNSIRQLERANCPLLGIVLNRAESSKGTYYRKYGRYGSRYGYGYGSSDYYYGSNSADEKEKHKKKHSGKSN